MRLLTAYGASDIRRNVDAGWWTSRTFGDALAEHARVRGSKVAVIDGDRRCTWSELDEAVGALAAGLATLGVRPEDRVSVQLPNSLELVTAILAIWEAGAVYQPLNPMYRKAEVSGILGLVRPTAVICPEQHRGFSHAELVDAVADEVGCAEVRVMVGPGSRPGWVSFDELVETHRGDRVDVERDAMRVALLGTTSGTTGTPKVYIHVQATQMYEASVLNRELEVTADDVFLAAAPITHRGALMFGLLTSVEAGAALVLGDARFVDEAASLISEHGVTTFMAIPTMVSDLVRVRRDRGIDMSSLRLVVVSGAPVTPELVEAFRDAWPEAVPSTGYGLSETGWCTVHRPADPVEKLSASGRATPGMELEIRDRSGAAVARGTTGEIHIRGPMVCAGYFDNQLATETAIDRDGWFASGDLGFLDDEGYIHPVGRSKHMIIRGGLNIYAEEIERLVEEHPSVEAAVVVGVPDERLGERACAVVSLIEGGAIDLAGLQRFFDDRGIAKYAWPERVEVVDELPRNPIGKIDRLRVAADLRAS